MTGRLCSLLMYFSYFIIYSFFGFILETLFALITVGQLQSRKCFLFNLLCPVYGLGAIAILLSTEPFKQNKPLTFLIGMAAATLVEYVTDYVYKNILGTSFWDYSHLPLNVNGRVCLLFSFFWGLLSLALVYIIHPFISKYSARIPNGVILFVMIFFTIDAVLSVILLNKYNTKNALNLSWLLAKR